MKKLFILSLLLCLTLSHGIVLGEMTATELLADDAAATAFEEPLFLPMGACDHVYRIPPNAAVISQGWYSVNDLYHEYRKFYRASCINEGCVSDTEVCVADQLAQHTWEYTGVNTHLKGKSLHAYTHRCPVCGHQKDYLFNCPGTGNGDCPAQIMKVGVSLQTQ